jgi:HlyD family secretion protein
MLNSAEELLAADQHNLDNSILKAPHAGVVTVINGTVGGAPGLPQNASTSSTTTSGNTFIQLVDTSSLQVQASVNETDTANLRIGEAATFTVNAYPNKTFRGTVSSISPLGQTVSNVVTYPVNINIDMGSVDSANLIPGMTANVTITVVNRTDVLLIPVNAVDFARLASRSSTSRSSTNGTPPLISTQAATAAMIEARQMLINLLQSQPGASADSPTPAYVIEGTASGQFIAKPVVLGLTDGTQYEVLEGLTTSDTVVVGIAANAVTGANTNPAPGSGG